MQKMLIATRLDEPTFKALQELAQRQERKVAFLVRKAVEQYVSTAQGQRTRALLICQAGDPRPRKKAPAAT